METTFNIEVTQFGWANPPLNANNPFGRYPVQISSELGTSLYGYVSGGGGGLYAGFIGDNPNTPATETDALSSCMVRNDDFEPFPETTQGSLMPRLRMSLSTLSRTATAIHCHVKIGCGMNPVRPTWKMRFLTTPTVTIPISSQKSKIVWENGRTVVPLARSRNIPISYSSVMSPNITAARTWPVAAKM